MSDNNPLTEDEVKSLREVGIDISSDRLGIIELKNTLMLEGMSEEDAWYNALSQRNML